MWRVFWGHRGQTQGGIYSRLMCSHVHVSNGLKYVWWTISFLTKTRQQNTEFPGTQSVLDFFVKPGAKINQQWGKNRLALTYGKGCLYVLCQNNLCTSACINTEDPALLVLMTQQFILTSKQQITLLRTRTWT